MGKGFSGDGQVYWLWSVERSQGNTAKGQELIARARELDPSLPAR